jgi:predicted secreted acid phosphatase
MQKIRLIIAFTLLISLTLASYAMEPENLEVLKQKLIQYHDSGHYAQDQKSSIKQAISYLKVRLAERKHKPYAIVLDIDDTALSDYPNLLQLRFGGTLEQLAEAEGKGNNPVIEPTLKFYQFAEENHIAVFFISGRNEKYRAATVTNLENVGYKKWEGIFLKPANYNKASNGPFKAYMREKIEKLGYDIVLNVGDQMSDFVGGHEDKTIKLPNPYYLIP